MSRKTLQYYLLMLTWVLACFFLLTSTSCHNQPDSPAGDCSPTPYDEIGPFYKQDSPERSSVGSGYLLEGEVKSTEGCRPLNRAKIEFWMVNEKGEYDDDHRATVYASRRGKYSFTSNRPTNYVGRLPHIHIMVSAKGHETLITQHYPKAGQAKGRFDLVLAITESD